MKLVSSVTWYWNLLGLAMLLFFTYPEYKLYDSFHLQGFQIWGQVQVIADWADEDWQPVENFNKYILC